MYVYTYACTCECVCEKEPSTKLQIYQQINLT